MVKKTKIEQQKKKKKPHEKQKSKHFKLAHNECSVSVSYYVGK